MGLTDQDKLRVAREKLAAEISSMATLICVTYEDEYRALEIFPTILRLQTEDLIDIEDTIILMRDQSGTTRVHRVTRVPNDVVDDTFWPTLLRVVLPPPSKPDHKDHMGSVTPTVLALLGIESDFAANLQRRLRPGTSAMLILIQRTIATWTIPDMSHFGGTIDSTPLHINPRAAPSRDSPRELSSVRERPAD